MRIGKRLIPDAVTVTRKTGPCPIQARSIPTSPSNIALDLLVQLEALEKAELYETARGNILHTLQTLAAIPRDVASGMFYNRYSLGDSQRLPVVVDTYLSSVDNVHLAYAFWTLSMVGPSESIKAARTLFESMDFNFFYDPQDGLFIGGIRTTQGKPVRDRWKYRYFGSEARSLYALGWALGLVKDPAMVTKAMRSLDVDVFFWNVPDQAPRELLGTWDGGAFQLLLPRLLIAEERYSPRLGRMFEAYGRYVIEEGRRQGYPVPAAHSACQSSPFEYLGKAGTLALVAPANSDLTDPELHAHWDEVFTPHAAFLVSPFLPDAFSLAMKKAEDLVDTAGNVLYLRGLGWMDALHVKGSQKNQIVPVQLSLDQAMIALATVQTQAHARDVSEIRMGIGARLLDLDPQIRERLRTFYSAANELLEKAPRYPIATGVAARNGAY